MTHGAVGSYYQAVARELAGVAGSRLPGVGDRIHEKVGYFEPLCTARHLSVRFYDWEPSRYVGDIGHLVALGLCLVCLLRDEEGTEGVSFKAHLIFLVVFSSRFLNIFLCEQPVYLVIYKVLLWQGTLMIVLIMCFRGSTRDKKDSLPLTALLLPVVAITLVFGRYSFGDHGFVAEILWFFSNYLEGIAMLPQYIYCYRDRENRHPLVFAYVLAMGGYQGVFGLHWILRLFVSADYLDMSSLINGMLGVGFFADYVVFKVRDESPLSGCCILVDKYLQEATDTVVTNAETFRRKVSFTLSGEMDLDFESIPTLSPKSPSGAEPQQMGMTLKTLAGEVELADATS